jgi:predicted aspartyl protease
LENSEIHAYQAERLVDSTKLSKRLRSALTTFAVVSVAFLLALGASTRSQTSGLGPIPRTAFASIATRPFDLPSAFVGRVLLKGTVNGIDLWFHFDTGTSVLVLGDDSARTLGLRAPKETGFSDPADLRLGGLHDPVARFLIASYGFESKGYRIAGIVGAPLFRNHVVGIDYAERRVTVYPGDTFQSESNSYRATSLVFRNGLPFVSMTMNSVSGLFLLDTGSSFTEVAPAFAARLRLGQPLRYVTMATFGGATHDAPVYMISRLAFDGTDFDNTLITVDAALDGPYDGILGRDLLSKFTFAIDYKDRQLFVRQGVSATAAPL